MFLILSSCETGIIQLNKNIWSSYYSAGTLPGTGNTPRAQLYSVSSRSFQCSGKGDTCDKGGTRHMLLEHRRGSETSLVSKGKFLRAVLLRGTCARESLGVICMLSWFRGSRAGPRVYMSNMLLGDAGAAGPRTTLWATKGSEDWTPAENRPTQGKCTQAQEAWTQPEEDHSNHPFLAYLKDGENK